MDTDKHRLNLPEGEITHAVIGAAFEVLNELGHGLHEKPYENALVIELALRHLPCDNKPITKSSTKATSSEPSCLT